MIQKPRGTIDILPQESGIWQYIENTMRDVARLFAFEEIRVPTFEHTELFNRGVGGTTDVVQKEMYTFTDRDNRSLTLRPEGTAGVVRSVIENGLYGGALPLKMYYITSCFRYEKPQAGRSREFYQFGAEIMGTSSPAADVTAMSIAALLFRRLGIYDSVRLEINSIGCPKCRPAYHNALRGYLSSRREELCDTCKGRLETNPLRVLDCKSPVCGKIADAAPKAVDNLCGECSEHMESVKTLLVAAGLNFTINPRIVRGLDYYTRTVFEFISDDIGAQSTVCGGGRYDGLAESLDGPALPGIGFGMGITRLIGVMQAVGAPMPSPSVPDIYIASMGAAAQAKALSLVTALRQNGTAAECDILGRSVKAQMKYADKTGARYTMVLGDSELASGKAVLKDMREGGGREIEIDNLKEEL
ncbi:MAG: histidine--tRNA ligase [Eubacteriales bacterium]